ncbi:MAG: PEGA domain-containing protein [Labilithrix sp.]|nr:PEGA domain-containing protein [Labilithrix sp.]MCW5810666.1 PEGA domain-containing protein [Labilithrix sp.]
MRLLRRVAPLVVAASVLAAATNAYAQAPSPADTPAPAPAPAPTPAPASTSAPVKISTSDLKGSIYIDGALVGEGTFTGELGSGTHELKIVREGYDTYTEQLVIDKDPVNKTLTLALSSNVQTQEVEEVEWLEGLYGGFTLLGAFTPGGTGSSLETQCERKGEIPTLLSCSTPDGLAGGVGGFFGYHWDPVGMELFLEGSYDARTIKNEWAAASTIGAISGDPARTEEFTVRRAGGVLAARVRVTKQWRKIRVTIPFGVGLSYRFMSLVREARATVTGATDRYGADTVSYLSPAIIIEPSVGYRLTKGISVTLGFRFLLEAPGTALDEDNPITPRGGIHRLGFEGLSTPAYELASNAQFFIGPTLGMMFGP